MSSLVVVALVSVTIGAGLKSITGIGMPFVTIPAIAMVATVEEAVVIGALPNLVLNIALAWSQRREWNATWDLAVLCGTALVGGAIGTFLLISLPERPIIAVLLLVVVLYLVLRIAQPSFSISRERSRRFSPAVGSVAGVMQGAVGISGPIVVSWIQSMRLDRNAQILAMTAMFTAAGISQFPVLVANGSLSGLWMLTLAACVPTLATIPLGERLRARLSSDGFDRFVLLLLAASALGLGWRAFT